MASVITNPLIGGSPPIEALSQGPPVAATIGNTACNALLYFYDNNSVGTDAYVIGTCNSHFTLASVSGPGYFDVNVDTIAVHNLVFDGAIYTNGGVFKSQWITEGCNIYIGQGSNVGIGTSNPDAPLSVVGNVAVDGNIYCTGVVLGSTAQVLGNSATVPLYLPAADGSRTVLTNDPVPANRVLFTFDVNGGNFLLQGSVPFANLDGTTAVDTIRWATIGLYEATPAGLATGSVPLAVAPLMSIGGQAGTVDYANISMFFQNATGVQQTYVVAVSGVGQQLQFGPPGTPAALLHVVPTRGLGTNDSYAVRQAMTLQPARKTFWVSAPETSNFTLPYAGSFVVDSSNVEVFINGTKFAYVQSNVADYTLLNQYDEVNNVSYFTITLAGTTAPGDVVDIAVWPHAAATDYFTAGYLYQNVTNYNTQWMNLDAGTGIRYSKDVYIDGNLYLNGQQYQGYSLSNVQASTYLVGELASNVFVGTGNIAPGSVTSALMSPTGIGAGTYGELASPGSIPASITVDEAGRIGAIQTLSNVALAGVSCGTAAIGTGYAGVAPPANGLVVQGNVGIGTGTVGPGFALQVQGSIYATGDVQALSDARHKRNLQVIDGALDRLGAIRGYTFERNAPIAAASRRHVGVLAQEVAGVLPEAVHTDPDGTMSVAYGNLVALLIEGIRELRSEYQTMRSECQTMRSEYQTMRSECDALRDRVAALGG